MGVKKVNIGELRHRIEFQTLSLTPDGQGGFTESWSEYTTVWAKVEPVKAYERLFSGAIQYQRTHKVLIRAVSGLTAKMRISFGGRFFQVKGVRDFDERGFFYEIDAEENQGT